MFILGGDSADIGTPNGTCTINLSTRRQPSAPSLEELNVQVRFPPLSPSFSLSLPLSFSLTHSFSLSLSEFSMACEKSGIHVTFLKKSLFEALK